MNVISAVKLYISKMITDCGPGMKVLLMDKETTTVVSMVFSQSEILAKEVYLCERIDVRRTDQIRHLKCIIFIRPTPENFDLLLNEIKYPNYGHYYIYFSNVVSLPEVKSLAEADNNEVVCGVNEFFADYVAVNPHLFTFNIVGCYQGNIWNPVHLKRTKMGLLSLLISLKKFPVFRYQASSQVAQRLVDELYQFLLKEPGKFNFRKQDVPPVLLILDRKCDAVTPMLNQWTYQALVHELIRIQNNRVNLSDVPDIPKEFQEIILTAEQDQFYRENMYLDFGQIATNIKKLMEEFQKESKTNQKVESIDDMKAFIERYPQFRKKSGTLFKHVTLIGYLSSMMSKYNLLPVSEVEQELACGTDHSEVLKMVRRLLENDKVRDIDAVRLVMLYALQYENHSSSDVTGLIESLNRRKVDENLVKMVSSVVDFGAGSVEKNTDVFSDKGRALKRMVTKGLKGVENIYTQHTPVLKEIIEDLIKGKLKESTFPHKGDFKLSCRPQDVIVFIIGGVTYQEALTMYQINRQGVARVIIGGTTIHNFTSFLEEIKAGTYGSGGRNSKFKKVPR